MVNNGVVRQTLRRIAHGVALSPGQSSLGGIWLLWIMDIIKGTPPFPLSPKLRKEPRNCRMRLQEKLEVFPLNALPDIRGSSKNVLLYKELFCSLVLDFSTDYYLIAFNANSDLSYFNP